MVDHGSLVVSIEFIESIFKMFGWIILPELWRLPFNVSRENAFSLEIRIKWQHLSLAATNVI